MAAEITAHMLDDLKEIEDTLAIYYFALSNPEGPEHLGAVGAIASGLVDIELKLGEIRKELTSDQAPAAE